MTAAKTKDRPAASGRPLKPESGGNRSSNICTLKEHAMSSQNTARDNFTPSFPAPNIEPPSWALARDWEWEPAARSWHRVVTSEANYIADVGDGGIRLVALQTARADGSVFTSKLSFDGDMFGRELTNPRLSLAQLIEWAAFVSAVLPAGLDDEEQVR